MKGTCAWQRKRLHERTPDCMDWRADRTVTSDFLPCPCPGCSNLTPGGIICVSCEPYHH